MTDVSKIIEHNMKKLGEEARKQEDFIDGVEGIVSKLIKDVLKGNSVASSDIESSIDKIVSKTSE